MEEQKQEEKTMVSLKRELTEEMESMPVEKLEKYGLSSSNVSSLLRLGINTLGELLLCDTDELYNVTKDEYVGWNLRYVIMRMGLLFNDDRMELEEVGVSDEIALIPITQLELSSRLKNALEGSGIFFLGDLLTYDYNDLTKVRKIGKDGIIKLKNYVHSLGYSLKNEELTLKEIVESFKEKEIPMVQESLELDGKTAGVLYRNGIYTVEDLINFGDRVFELVGMGDFKTKRLKEAMESHNVRFGTIVAIPKEGPAAIRPSEIIVQRLKKENAAIKERIERKEKLVSEYEELIAEREQLLAKEKSLDDKISKKLALLQTQPAKEEGSSYGRR